MALTDHNRPVDQPPCRLRRQGLENDLEGVGRRHMGVAMTVNEVGLDSKVSGFGKKVHSARCLHATVTRDVANLSKYRKEIGDD